MPGALPPDPRDEDRAGKAEEKILNAGMPSPIYLHGHDGGSPSGGREHSGIPRFFAGAFVLVDVRSLIFSSGASAAHSYPYDMGVRVSRTPAGGDRRRSSIGRSGVRRVPLLSSVCCPPSILMIRGFGSPEPSPPAIGKDSKMMKPRGCSSCSSGLSFALHLEVKGVVRWAPAP
ncbi:hypothetical protein J2129_000261 [Methanofollis sp. W23]|nr:hypothetical protein [Methanofollis sp. W23]